MRLAGKVIVITGAAAGIGKALALRFARENPAAMLLADLDESGARSVAAETRSFATRTDVSQETDIGNLVALAESQFSRIDLFCSNAGIMVRAGLDASNSDWDRIWRTNVMAHVWAARAALPGMLARGEGCFLHTVSAAGLLNQIGSAPYGVTKHAAIGFAEWLSIEYGDRGIQVSCLCPQGVRTAMLDAGHFLAEGALSPDQVAEEAARGLEAGDFLILPHPEVLDYFRRKASDYGRWLRGMRRLRARVTLDSTKDT
ncbi:MAG: SDR family oxidoreductase [Acidimicrobiia bacterium]|nr:SDR family oxidoreductase [Acidimicrobiia bacterium]